MTPIRQERTSQIADELLAAVTLFNHGDFAQALTIGVRTIRLALTLLKNSKGNETISVCCCNKVYSFLGDGPNDATLTLTLLQKRYVNRKRDYSLDDPKQLKNTAIATLAIAIELARILDCSTSDDRIEAFAFGSAAD